MGKIYCFINGGQSGWYSVLAMSEDGYPLAGHLSSSIGWGKLDIGMHSNNDKHEAYRKHYPEGYELIWIDDPLSDKEFAPVLALANEILVNKEAEVI